MSETTTPQTPSQSCEHVSLKEIRKELYDLRKAEAQDQWKKFIFFAIVTIVLAWFYKPLITTFITNYPPSIGPKPNRSDYSFDLELWEIIYKSWYDNADLPWRNFLTEYNSLNINSCLIAIIGLIASITWLTKVKKSQARISIFEQRIRQIEQALPLETPKDYRMSKENPYTVSDLLHTEEAKFHTGNRGSILLGKATTVFWWMAFSLHTACILCTAYGDFMSAELNIKIIFVLLCTVPITIIYLLKKRNTKH